MSVLIKRYLGSNFQQVAMRPKNSEYSQYDNRQSGRGWCKAGWRIELAMSRQLLFIFLRSPDCMELKQIRFTALHRVRSNTFFEKEFQGFIYQSVLSPIR